MHSIQLPKLYKGFERAQALIIPKELKGHLDAGDPEIVVLAVARWDQRLKDGCIPGAQCLWRGDYTTKDNVQVLEVC